MRSATTTHSKINAKTLVAASCFAVAFGVNTVIADQVISNDLIVDGSTCIGQDCVNGESFGFDTLRLKENNLRIKFVDTSNSASFPTRDWQLTANDSSNGGANKFSIDDIDGSRTPFTIEAGAPSHSLYVEDSGRIGLGTNVPVADIHTKSGNTPTLRLEQDGSSGFSPQTWDVAGNEANFFIRDAKNGSTLPFRIFPGAPSDAFVIEGSTGTGDIGLNTKFPTANLHIVETEKSDWKTLLKLQHDGNPEIQFESTDSTYGNKWALSAGTNFVFKDANASPVLYVKPNGDILFQRKGAAGSWVSLQEVLDT